MATGNAIRSFTLEIDELGWTGHDLQRPESVVAELDGMLWVSDGRGGVTRIDPDGNLVTANIGLGMVQRMTRDGQVAIVLEEVDGRAPPAPASCSTTAQGGCG